MEKVVEETVKKNLPKRVSIKFPSATEDEKQPTGNNNNNNIVQQKNASVTEKKRIRCRIKTETMRQM